MASRLHLHGDQNVIAKIYFWEINVCRLKNFTPAGSGLFRLKKTVRI
jgi:hypothetical protein